MVTLPFELVASNHMVVLAKINDQLKGEYMLTYSLNREDREEGFHRLQWGTKQKDQLLQAPGGFYVE